MSGADPRATAEEQVLAALGDAGLAAEQVGEHQWMTVLSGENKRVVPVLVEVGERSLVVTSLFTGVPDEGHLDVYRILLERNQPPSPVHFALDDAGDVVLVGRLPLVAVDTDTVDELLGVLLAMADETFARVLRAGFAGYIDVEQRWRAKVGLPENPVGGTP